MIFVDANVLSMRRTMTRPNMTRPGHGWTTSQRDRARGRALAVDPRLAHSEQPGNIQRPVTRAVAWRQMQAWLAREVVREFSLPVSAHIDLLTTLLDRVWCRAGWY